MDSTIETPKCKSCRFWLLLVSWLAMLVFAGHSVTRMVGAGDTWVAMACGRHFYNHGVDTVEPFSANSHKPGPTAEEVKHWPEVAQWITEKVGLDTVKYWHPTGWINQNWLTHLIFYWLTTESPFADAESFSFNTLVWWKLAIYILTVVCVFYTARILGAHIGLAAFFACAAVFIGRSFLDIRPAGFSNLLTAVFLLILVLATYRNILYIWLVVPLTVLWCNLHGGYIYVFITLVPFVGMHLLGHFFPKHFVTIGKRGLYHTIACGIVSFFAMIVFNPFHLTNLTHTYVISFSKHAEKWREVHEWHPAFKWDNPVGTGFPFMVMLVVGIGLTLVWLFSRWLKPRLLKAPKSEMLAQKKFLKILAFIIGSAAAVFLGWSLFLGFSLLNLDAWSFIIAAFFILIVLLSVYKNVHFIYAAGVLALIAMWSADASDAYQGRYIYPFLILPLYVIAHIAASVFSPNLKKKPVNISFAALTAVVSLVLIAAIFNPFEFKLPLWNLGQFLHILRPWRPIYEGLTDFGYVHLFTVLYLLNIASTALWLMLPHLQAVFAEQKTEPLAELPAETWHLPKIDLAMLAVAGLTVYLALKSRRFIPMAAIAACPVMAMFVDQVIKAISAARNFYRSERFVVSPMPARVLSLLILISFGITMTLGTWWSLRFKRVFLDPWPTDTVLNSVFMRMTASNMKPFWLCQFIRDNKLEGKIFNYWTEGGFLAWGQEPDPITGRTPLQLFMDGRAQAAYERTTFDLWGNIMYGGEIIFEAYQNGRRPADSDYVKAGAWINEQLKAHNVWVTAMPSAQFESDFIRSIERCPNWACIFTSDIQRLYVDISTIRGKELFEGIFNGKTIYPDEFFRNMAYAHNLYRYYPELEAKRNALSAAVKAFKMRPSSASLGQVLAASHFSELVPSVTRVCLDYLAEWDVKRNDWTKQSGYHYKISAAIIAADYMVRLADAEKRPQEATSYTLKRDMLVVERLELIDGKRW